VLSAFLAGISGRISAIRLEIVNAENVGISRSGGMLFTTFTGGTDYCLGRVSGAICYTCFVVAIAG
jgi:branched-chain amino acid transport system permease protein